MTKQKMISAYTPSNTDPELLKRVFVQREQLLDRIVDRLSISMTSGDKHHLLLVGPRGSGKTHMVTLANWELKQSPKLSDSMRIAWLGEDDTFSGLIHFAFGIARSLADEYPDESPEDFKSSVRGLPPDDAALAVLNSVIAGLKHRHLLLITENLIIHFKELANGGRKSCEPSCKRLAVSQRWLRLSNCSLGFPVEMKRSLGSSIPFTWSRSLSMTLSN